MGDIIFIIWHKNNNIMNILTQNSLAIDLPQLRTDRKVVYVKFFKIFSEEWDDDDDSLWWSSSYFCAKKYVDKLLRSVVCEWITKLTHFHIYDINILLTYNPLFYFNNSWHYSISYQIIQEIIYRSSYISHLIVI